MNIDPLFPRIYYLVGTEEASGYVPWVKFATDEGEDVALASAEAGNLDLIPNPKLAGVPESKVDNTSVLF